MDEPTSKERWFDDDAELEAELREVHAELGTLPAIRGYLLEKEIGRGGQGVVYSALQEVTRRRVAVKFLADHPGRSIEARRRFEREIAVAASLRDARIVQVLDGGTTEEGRPYIVMELVDGVRSDVCGVVAEARAAGFARGTADPALELFAEIAGALDVAHRRGVIHRDLKPSNIFVDAEGKPRVLDFGLAKASGLEPLQSTVSQSHQFLGTLLWASPEQAEGRNDDVGVRSDVYALGATFYDLVTGRPPCRTECGIREVLDSIVTGTPERPSKLDARTDLDLEAILLRALEKDPERRYASMKDLENDLRRCLKGEALEARRETTWRSMMRAARRHRRIAIGASILAAVAIGVGIFVAVLWRKAARDSERAKESLNLLFDSFASVDPLRDGAEVKLVDALEHVSLRLDDRLFAEEDWVRLTYRRALRDIYIRLGRFDRALVEAERVAEATKHESQARGTPAFRSHWNGETNRAIALYRTGRGAEARELYAAAHRELEAAFGPKDPDALGALVGVGQVLKSERKLDEAAALFSQTIASTEGARTLKDGASPRAMALEHLAHIYEMVKDPEKALPLQAESLSLFELLFGAESLDALLASSNLGNLYLTLGRTAEALAILQPTVDRFTKRWGRESPFTLSASHNLGVALARSGDLEKGAKLLHDVLEIRRRKLGPEAPDTKLTEREWQHWLKTKEAAASKSQ